jgi:hypothetical protein
MDARKPAPRTTERRARQRTGRDNQTTSLVQMILLDPGAAGDMLENDIKEGGDPDVVLGLLDAAEAVFQLRGVNASAKLAALRQRLKRLTG